MRPRLFPSTTSHKHEPLLPTLEVFARLGFSDLDLNLGHMIEGDLSIDRVIKALQDNGQTVWIASGGWCDFFDDPPRVEDTFRSVERQVELTRCLGARALRLFYGRLALDRWSPEALGTIARNVRRLSETFPDMMFVLENHGRGAASRPEICRAILEQVAAPNVRMNFDPVNFEHAGIKSLEALRELERFIGHVHLKGSLNGECCEFGSGDVNLRPVLHALSTQGYDGAFTVEYEGRFDRTLRLYESMRAAAAALGA